MDANNIATSPPHLSTPRGMYTQPQTVELPANKMPASQSRDMCRPITEQRWGDASLALFPVLVFMKRVGSYFTPSSAEF